jgi:uncharacterized protein
LNAYLDASALFSQFMIDVHTPRLMGWLAGAQDRIVLSEWTLAEFSSALAVAQRMGRLSSDQRQRIDLTVDAWLVDRKPPYAVLTGDGLEARRFIRGSVRPLRAGDALHLAIAQRLGFSIVTFDNRMAAAATDLGIPVEDV